MPKKSASVDHNFFSKNTPKVFYWAGFIAADGCVMKKNEDRYKVLVITLSIKDKDHLLKFKRAIKYKGSIYENDKPESGTAPYCSIQIRSDKIFNDLKRFGVVPQKSLIFKLPSNMKNHKLINHFLRGYADGDGSWGIRTRRGRKDLRLTLLGTKQFLEMFKYILNKNCNISNKQGVRLINKIYCVVFSGANQIKSVRGFIYKGATPSIMLKRKKDIAYDKELYKPYKKKKPRIGVHIDSGKIIFLESGWAGRLCGFSPASLDQCCKGRQKSYKGYRWRYATKKESIKYGLE